MILIPSEATAAQVTAGTAGQGVYVSPRRLSTAPVNAATQAELDLKAPIASPTFTGTVSGVTASMVGLGNVDNTSDANKPVSTATQAALNLKAGTSAENTFSVPQVISGTSESTMLRVTQLGSGEAFRVEDSTHPDSTAFVISNNGNVGIGVGPDANVGLSVKSSGIKFSDGSIQASSATGIKTVLAQTTGNVSGIFSGESFLVAWPTAVLVVDGYTPNVGGIVVFTSQANPVENGFWRVVVNNGLTQPILERPTWFSSITGSVSPLVYITRFGATQGGFVMALTGPLGNSSIAVGTSPITVHLISGRGGIDPLLGIANSTLTFIADASNNVKGYGLLTIPDNWQDGESTLKGLSIGAGVTSIGSGAFNYCSGFTGPLTIPNSVTSIGNYAFGFCSGFTSLTIPNSVTTIGTGAFNHCTGFTSLTIPNSVTTIGSYAFNYCTGFTGSLTIPNSVTSIGSYAFQYCSGFTGPLTIPNSVTSIGSGAFSSCSGFTGPLTIPNSVTSIGTGAFNYCSGFTGPLTIPNSVTSIGNYAFNYCSGFTGSLTIPNSVTTIGSYAFNYCTGFTGSLTIPNSVTSIGDYAFQYSSGITNAQCRVTKTIIDGSDCFLGTGITTINARASDGTWTAGAGQTIGGKSGITVIKNLV
jgi:BspA type Leucine rich repeat region (6 copies)